ncbi:hypothetical protein [Stratiformator vulcanicus]|nr:hypothetical protein [Stratiformator vulcanicus]
MHRKRRLWGYPMVRLSLAILGGIAVLFYLAMELTTVSRGCGQIDIPIQFSRSITSDVSLHVELIRRSMLDTDTRLFITPHDANQIVLHDPEISKSFSDIYYGLIFQRFHHTEPEDAAVFIFISADGNRREDVALFLPTIPHWREAGEPPLIVPVPDGFGRDDVTAFD